jgi:hypothetical protein
MQSPGDVLTAADTPDCRFWLQNGDGPGCMKLPSAQVNEHLRRQMEMDILRELSPSMRRLIAPERWQRLRSAVRETRKPPPWGLDPRAENELDLDVPAELLAAVAVILAGHHDPVVAGEVADKLGIEEHDLSPARRLLVAILEPQGDIENIDPDTVLSLASWQHRAVCDMSRAYSFPHYQYKDAPEDEAGAALDRLRWLATTTLHAAEGAVICLREQDMRWSSAKVLRWCARVASLLLAVEASRLAADRDLLKVISRRLSGTPYEVPENPAALFDQVGELATIAASVYVGFALVDIRSRPGLSNLGGAVLLAREPVYGTLHGEEATP